MDGSLENPGRTDERTDGRTGLIPQVTSDESDDQKWVNDEVSGNGTRKIEFSTIKNHYKDIHNGILDKHYKKAPKRGVFSPKRAPRAHPGVTCSTDQQNYVATNQLQLFSKFHQNPRHKFFTITIKVSFLALLGYFGAFLTLKRTLEGQPELCRKIPSVTF